MNQTPQKELSLGQSPFRVRRRRSELPAVNPAFQPGGESGERPSFQSPFLIGQGVFLARDACRPGRLAAAN